MKKIILFGIVAFIALGAWQWIDGMMGAEKLRGVMRDAVENAKNQTDLEVRDAILGQAQRQGIFLTPAQVKVQSQTVTGGGALSGVINNQGITSDSSRKVQAEASYTYKVLGLTFSPVIQNSQTFTQARLIERPMPAGE